MKYLIYLKPKSIRFGIILILLFVSVGRCGKNVDTPLTSSKAAINDDSGGNSPYNGVGANEPYLQNDPGGAQQIASQIPADVAQAFDPIVDVPRSLSDLYNNPGDLNTASAPLKALLSALPRIIPYLDSQGAAIMAAGLQQISDQIAQIKKDTPKEQLKAILKKIVGAIMSLLKQLKGHVKKK